jgi:phosphoglycerate dehydrogenase-like enzyme
LINTEFEEDLPSRIASVAPDARIIMRQDIKAAGELVETVDVVYGKLSEEQFTRAKNLKWLHSASAGMDFALSAAAGAHRAVFTKSHIHAEVMSEHLFAMLLALFRRLDIAHSFQLDSKWDRPAWEQVDVLSGKTLCIVGAGVIGRRCAMLAEAFGMEVIAVRRCAKPTPHAKKVYPPEQLHEALRGGDVVVAILPNTPETKKMIDADAFAAMPNGAVFLNVGRGQTVDTDALLEALKSGRLRAAGLDVTDPEPLPADHPLWAQPNVLITCHYAGMFPRYNIEAGAVFIENLRRFLAGDELLGVMDREAGY